MISLNDESSCFPVYHLPENSVGNTDLLRCFNVPTIIYAKDMLNCFKN